jgi:hypothetical protein
MIMRVVLESEADLDDPLLADDGESEEGATEGVLVSCSTDGLLATMLLTLARTGELLGRSASRVDWSTEPKLPPAPESVIRLETSSPVKLPSDVDTVILVSIAIPVARILM